MTITMSWPGVCRAGFKQQTFEHNQHSTHCQQHSHTWRWWESIYSWEQQLIWQHYWQSSKQIGGFFHYFGSYHRYLEHYCELHLPVPQEEICHLFSGYPWKPSFPLIIVPAFPYDHSLYSAFLFTRQNPTNSLFADLQKYPEGQLRFPVWSLIPFYASFLDIYFL